MRREQPGEMGEMHAADHPHYYYYYRHYYYYYYHHHRYYYYYYGATGESEGKLAGFEKEFA